MKPTPMDPPKLADVQAGQSNMFTTPIPAPVAAPSAPAPAEAKEPWEREVFIIALRAAGVGAPVAVRVRKLLKAALRTYGLRAVVAPDLTAAQRAAFFRESHPGILKKPQAGGAGA